MMGDLIVHYYDDVSLWMVKRRYVKCTIHISIIQVSIVSWTIKDNTTNRLF